MFSHSRMSAGREFQVDGAATEKARRASSVCMRGTTSIGASEHRKSAEPEVVHGSVPECTGLSYTGACSTAHRSNRPDHWDGLMLDRSAVGQLSSSSSRTKWQRLPAGDTLRSVSPASNRCHFVLVDKDESCPTADLSNIRPSQWSGLFGRPVSR